ncbi:hypothetical protein CRYUN_Cryun25bG0092500 [Craigia yunnanensis]
MRIARVLFGSLEGGLQRPCQHLQSHPNSNSFESAEEFERRIFGGYSGDSPKTQSFYEKLDRLGRLRDRSGSPLGSEGESMAWMRVSITLSDGMDGKLKKAATYFEFDPEEIDEGDYAFRSDVSFQSGMTYELKDLDLRRPGVRKPARNITFDVTTEEVLRKVDFREALLFRRPGVRKPARNITFDVTTEEVLRKVDFRNVRFLANFLTEAGIIVKRSSTGISAKA